jgi:hypothetical protein
MGTWSENWKAVHSGYVRKNAGVKSVMEHRTLKDGEIYCVAMNGGTFEVRRYVGAKLEAKESYPSGTKAVLAYRALRDKLVPKKATKKEAVKKKATKKEAVKKEATKKEATKKEAAKK